MTSFAPIPGLPAGYIADSDGNMYGPRKVLSPGVHSKWGHAQINFMVDGKRHHVGVHRAVFAAFHGPIPDGMLVRHLNGDARDNRISNLCLGTYQDNADDQRKHGNVTRGSSAHNAKLTEEVVRDARRRYRAGGVTKTALAIEYGVSDVSMGYAIEGRTWRHVC